MVSEGSMKNILKLTPLIQPHLIPISIRICLDAFRWLLFALFMTCFSATAKADTAATEAVAIIPEDPLIAQLRFSDKTINYEKNIYLRDYLLGGSSGWWIDDYRYVISLHESKYFSEKADNTPKVVIVDTKTGDVTDTGYEGRVLCYSEGRIATNNNRLTTGQDGKVISDEVYYYGKMGEPLDAFRPYYPSDMELNKASCQLIPRWKRPQSPDMVFPLKVAHGVIRQIRPKDFPELRLGQDDYNRLTFNRTGAAVVPPLQVYWELPSGQRTDIPFNPGEQISSISYIPFENAYLISPDLTNTQPIKTWEPRFVRLLYLDGTVKRFGVPRVIMDLVKANKVGVGVGYSKKGISWDIGFLSRVPDPQHLAGSYEVIGDELVKREQSGSTSPDGCRLYSSQSSFFSKRWDYYYIDICKGR